MPTVVQYHTFHFVILTDIFLKEVSTYKIVCYYSEQSLLMLAVSELRDSKREIKWKQKFFFQLSKKKYSFMQKQVRAPVINNNCIIRWDHFNASVWHHNLTYEFRKLAFWNIWNNSATKSLYIFYKNWHLVQLKNKTP